jgi:hypothetical protein
MLCTRLFVLTCGATLAQALRTNADAKVHVQTNNARIIDLLIARKSKIVTNDLRVEGNRESILRLLGYHPFPPRVL